MSSRAPDLLSSIFASGLQPSAKVFPRSLIPMRVRGGGEESAGEFTPPVSKRRTAIWDMHPSVHCSIIGTCLSGGEIRRLLIKLGVHGAESASDHDLHKQGVALSGKPQGGGKFIQKALDRRHEAAIKQFAKAEDENALGRLWDEAVKRGDIPGAYWAVLSHPAATDAIMRKTFGDVHMLSHMVGAANRADIRRLRQLEEENAALSAKLDLQQCQLRDGFTARDHKIQLLNEALSRALAQAPVLAEHASDDARAAKEALVDLDRRLSREVARRERLESRLEAATLALSQAERARHDAERECAGLRRELSLIEAQISGACTEDHKSDGLELDGVQVLYVGGRANQVPQLKAAVERAGGVFLHHDGGIEHSMTLLPGLLSRADCAVFPIDCISHDAMGTVKRQCRQSAKPFIPLRTASLASLLSGLASLERLPQPVAAVN
jgi:Uncharacterized protein conserved in bacteria (DUF2325)